MASGTRIVLLEMAGQTASLEIQEAIDQREAGIEAVVGMHERVMKSLHDLAPDGTAPSAVGYRHPAALAYANRLREHAQHLVEAERQAHHSKSAAEVAQLASEAERRAQEVLSELGEFCKAGELPILGSRYGMRLIGNRHEVVVVFRNPNAISTGFTLNADRVPAWKNPRRVAEFQPNCKLGVGVKKSLFKSSVTSELVLLDDYLISRFDLTADAAEISLRKKIELKDAYTFRLHRTPEGTTGEVERLDDPSAHTLGNALEASDVAQLEQLWIALDGAFRELLPFREKTTVLELDGQDVAQMRLGMQLIMRLVTMFAPIVSEISERSPNEHELSLKVEHESGRREEIYLRREDLLKKLQPLPAAGREIFSALGLDSWVPALTLHPPEVM